MTILSANNVRYFLVSILVLACTFFLYYQVTSRDKNLSANGSDNVTHSLQKCPAKAEKAVLIQFGTKLGVNYYADHWFHMSELIMTQHSILRHKRHLVKNASVVLYNFDKSKSTF